MMSIALCALYVGCGHRQHPVLEKYAADEAVQSLLLVQQTEGANALATLYTKANGGWHMLWTDTAYIGRNGTGKEREGDGKTPLGELHITTAFGILPNPGSRLPYTEAYPSLYACDDDCEHYNQLIDTALVHHDCHGEHIINIDPDYHYILTTDYNADCVPGKGSNIFVHCKGSTPSTGGCIALDEEHMKQLMQVADTNTLIYVE